MPDEDKPAATLAVDGDGGGGTPNPRLQSKAPVGMNDRLMKWAGMLSLIALGAFALWALKLVSQRYQQSDGVAVKDMEEQYNGMIRKFGMSPVYPPREDFRVGDLFFTAFDGNRDAVARVWVGNMEEFVKQADQYAESFRSRPENASLPRERPTGAEPGREAEKEQPADPHVNQWLESLPIVSFPTIRGSSAGAAAFGGNARNGSVFLSDSQISDVSIEFPNVRAHGFPKGAATVDTSFKNEFIRESCPHLTTVQLMMEQMLRQTDSTCTPSVARDAEKAEQDAKAANLEYKGKRTVLRDCQIELVTRVYLTDQIDFSYSRNNGTQAGAGYGFTPKMPTVSAPASTADAAGNLGQAPGRADPAGALADLAADRSKTRAGAAASIETTDSLVFSKSFNRAVTIGFDSVTPIYMSWDECLTKRNL